MNTKLLRNALFGAGSTLLISVVALVTAPVIVHGLTVEGYGVFLVVTSLVGYYAIADLGLGQAVVKFVAEFKARDDLAGISRVINSALVVQIVLGASASIVLILLNEPLLIVLKVSDAYRQEAHLGVIFCAIGFFASMLGGTFSSVVTGLQRYDILSKIDVSVNVGLNLLLASIAWWKLGILPAIECSVLATSASALVYFLKVRKLCPDWRFRVSRESLVLRPMFQYSGYMFMSKISNLLSRYIIQFIISVFIGPASVAFYAVPAKVTAAVGGLMSGGIGVIFPFASEISVTLSPEERQLAFIKGSRVFTAIAIPMSLVFVVFAKPLLAAWMGTEFAEKSWIVLSIISLSSMIGAFTAVPNLMLMGFGRTKLIAMFGGIAVLSFTIFLPILTWMFGLVGAAVGMLFASSLNLVFVISFSVKAFGVGLFNYLNAVYRIHVFPAIVAASAFAIQLLAPEFAFYAYMLGVLGVVIHLGILLNSKILPLRELAELTRGILTQH